MADITYTGTYETLVDKAKREVSKLGAHMVDEQGVPIYDSVKIYSNDEVVVKDLLLNAAKSLALPMNDIMTVQEVTSNSEDGIKVELTLPDRIPANDGAVQDCIEKYIVYLAVATWFETRNQGASAHYSSLAKVAAETLVPLVRTRKKPTRV